jgi:hypothetical protein
MLAKIGVGLANAHATTPACTERPIDYTLQRGLQRERSPPSPGKGKKISFSV